MKHATCAHCGARFSYQNKGKVRKYCSHACYAASMDGSDRGGTVTLICEACGKPFTVIRARTWRVGRANPRRFCSHACARPAINEAHQKHQERACLMCGTMFMPRMNNGRLSEFCSLRCFGDSGRAPKALIAMQEAGAPSSIERRMMDALDRAGVHYTSQYPIYGTLGLKRYVCDFAFPDAMLIVECDGDYWHAQPKAIASDKRKNSYLHKRGYTVLRFTEAEINQNVDRCVQVILNHLR